MTNAFLNITTQTPHHNARSQLLRLMKFLRLRFIRNIYNVNLDIFQTLTIVFTITVTKVRSVKMVLIHILASVRKDLLVMGVNLQVTT